MSMVEPTYNECGSGTVVTDLGLKIKPCLMQFRDGTGHLMISNPTGFTQKLERGCKIGTLQDAEEVLPPPIEVNTETLTWSAVKMVRYWQVLVHPGSKEKTAFVTPHELHQFRVMPFGLTNAPAVF